VHETESNHARGLSKEGKVCSVKFVRGNFAFPFLVTHLELLISIAFFYECS